jgi:hypothetical protein
MYPRQCRDPDVFYVDYKIQLRGVFPDSSDPILIYPLGIRGIRKGEKWLCDTELELYMCSSDPDEFSIIIIEG